MKKIHSRNSGRESEAAILGNDREREFPLTPGFAECFWNLEKPECDEDEEIESDSCLPERDWAKVGISEKGQRFFPER